MAAEPMMPRDLFLQIELQVRPSGHARVSVRARVLATVLLLLDCHGMARG